MRFKFDPFIPTLPQKDPTYPRRTKKADEPIGGGLGGVRPSKRKVVTEGIKARREA